MDIIFTDREADLMEVLWEHGPSTVAEVRARVRQTFEVELELEPVLIGRQG